MHDRQADKRSSTRAGAAAVLAAALLAGCGHWSHGRWDRGDGDPDGGHMGHHGPLTAPELAKRFIEPTKAAGAFVFNKKGEVVLLDEFGKVVEPCRLCDEGSKDPACRENRRDAAQYKPSRVKICRGTVDTTLRGLQAFGIVRHKGSECILISAHGHADFYTYQICW